MALTTAITNEDIAHQIRDIYFSDTAFNEKMYGIREMFVKFIFEEDNKFMSVPNQLEQYKSQSYLEDRLNHFVRVRSAAGDEIDVSGGDEYQDGAIFEGVIATVDWFDVEKGFGFVDIEEVDGQIFLHAQQLQQNGIDLVSDGDDLLCDVGRNAKGLYIAQVHDIETDLQEVEAADCRIVRIFDDRGYGFVQIAESARDAFFHFSVVPSTDREKLKVGLSIRAQIKGDKNGRGLQVTKIHFVS